ncbi:hypothetical protein Cgig2_031388 [Carnegiea gigantea]|uniref:Pentatricopeptide repeat-containing protein n=1 Tax=Carnegiea gigantea TaxID=171969 RepID=A0A9Q1K730_9CARY|nr:hypothetical protein Cgig2_031388 [Carnegiea gigantea]
MTPISRLFRRAFPSSASPTSISRVIGKEPDLRRVVDAFKEYSENKKFRRKTTYYEHIVKRLANAKRFQWIEEILEKQKDYPEITAEGFVVRIISLYGKAGMFDHAHKVFDEMPHLPCNRTVKSFNALLGACVSSRKFDKIDGLFRELPVKLSVKPDTVSYNTLIKAFCEMGSLDSAILIFHEMVKERLNPDLITFNTLLDGLYKKDRFLDGEKMWDLMEEYNVVPDVISYNMKLHRLVSNKKVHEVVDLVTEMKSKGLKPDVFTYNTLFKGLCNIEKNLEEAKRWYGDMKKAKCVPNRLTFATLLIFACDKGDFLFASQLCRAMIYYQRELNDGTLLQKVVDGLVKQSNIEEAETLLQLFQRSLFKSQKSSLRPPPNKQPIKIDPHFSIQELINEPDPDEMARKFKQRATQFSSFRDRNGIYDFTIGRLALAKRFSLVEDILEAHKGFEDITREGFTVRLIKLYGKAGMFEYARKVFDEMPQLNCTRTVRSLNALMKAALDCKKFDEVLRIFRELPLEMSVKLNSSSYNTIIHALCEMGLLDDAVLMVGEMKDDGLKPNVVTFNTLLEALYKERGFWGGERIWAMMLEHNVLPDNRSYALKLQALVEAGHFYGALDLFRQLEKDGLKPDVNAYNYLIKGFFDQGNAVAAKRWYCKLLESGETLNRITFSVLVPRFCDVGDYNMAFDLCKMIVNRQFVVDEALLQRVVNGLVKVSRTEEAKELVELGKSNSYIQYNLTLPSDV